MTAPVAYFRGRRLLQLEAAAQQWAGTPWRDNSCVAGGGANCVGAIAGVLRQAGFDVPDWPRVPSDWARHQQRSIMEEWLDAHGKSFAALDMTRDELRPGDILGFRVGLCVHHLGLLLGGSRFLQCSPALGTVILGVGEREFTRRLWRAWRPLESE